MRVFQYPTLIKLLLISPSHNCILSQLKPSIFTPAAHHRRAISLPLSHSLSLSLSDSQAWWLIGEASSSPPVTHQWIMAMAFVDFQWIIDNSWFWLVVESLIFLRNVSMNLQVSCIFDSQMNHPVIRIFDSPMNHPLQSDSRNESYEPLTDLWTIELIHSRFIYESERKKKKKLKIMNTIAVFPSSTSSRSDTRLPKGRSVRTDDGD